MKKEEGFGGGSSMMQDLFGSVRRSLHFRPNLDSDESANASSSVADRIGSCIRKSRVGLGGLLPKSPSRRLTMGFGFEKIVTVKEEEVPQIRWRKGELIGAGAYGQVFMGMNLDSGELLAVKQVVIGNTDASKEKAQAHIKELEEEVKLLKNLSHPNIVRYLGTVREEGTLNILLEFVPGGSISSLLSKFGSFPETVIRMYTKQILQGLDYLHQHKIIHRDIKGANILVDNKGCIKLADFGASKKVAQLATMAAAKSFKGTPYWMAPEVIVQTGHTFSADIWSVGCTVIEMATGKPPWSGQYQEVAAIFHVGTTKSHPPIPDHLSSEARDFLLKCLQEDARLRPSASVLLQHPFVSGELKAGQSLNRAVSKESSNDMLGTNKTQTSNFGTITCSAIVPEWDAGMDGEMCRLDYEDDFPIVGTESFNPMSEPFDEWPSVKEGQNGNFQSESATCEEEEEVTENNIKAFLDAKALDLTKLCEELFNSIKSTNARVVVTACKENTANETGFVLPRSGSSRIGNPSPGFSSRRVSHGIGGSTRVLKEIDVVQKPPTFSKIHEAWREELVQEMDMHREILGLAPPSRMTSPKDSPLNHKRNRPIINNNNK